MPVFQYVNGFNYIMILATSYKISQDKPEKEKYNNMYICF